MTTSEDRINQKLDSLQKTVNTINTSLAEHLATDRILCKRNEDMYKTVHGNGGIGLKTKMYIIWGGLGLAYMLVIGFILRHGL